MDSAIDFLLNNPLPNILIILGILLVAISLIRRIGPWIDLDEKKSKNLILFGVILMLSGVCFLVIPITHGKSQDLIPKEDCVARKELMEAINLMDEIIEKSDYAIIEDEVVRDHILAFKQNFENYLQNEGFCQDNNLIGTAKEELDYFNKSIKRK